MEKKASITNFSSNNLAIEYFKHTSLPEWTFNHYRTHIIETNRLAPRPGTIYKKYQHCLRALMKLSDISEEAREVVSDLMEKHSQEPEQQVPGSSATYNYNYGSIGVLGNVAVLPAKRTYEELSNSVEASSSQSTDDSYKPEQHISTYGEGHHTRKYILTLDEFGDDHFNQKAVYNMDEEIGLDERLRLSCINYVETCPASLLQPFIFSDEFYGEIRKWRRLVLLGEDYFPCISSATQHEEKIFYRDLGSMLLYLKESIDRPPPFNSYKQSEMDFILQNVAVLLRFVFSSKSRVHACWEQPFATKKDNEQKSVRTDFLLYTADQELGCGEVKLGDGEKRFEEEDRARLAESMKRQLHARIRQAKSSREFSVFGVFVVGATIELYCCSFTVEDGYSFTLLKKISLPILQSTYTSLEESLEILFGFKALIENSLPLPSDLEQPYVYQDYVSHLKPTISFCKSSR